jgi:hypothetical protein
MRRLLRTGLYTGLLLAALLRGFEDAISLWVRRAAR